MHGVGAFDDFEPREKSVQNNSPEVGQNNSVDVNDLQTVNVFGDTKTLTATEKVSNVSQNEESPSKQEGVEDTVKTTENLEESINQGFDTAIVSVVQDEDDEDDFVELTESCDNNSDSVNFTLKGKLAKQEVVPIVGIHDYSEIKTEDIDVDDLSEKLKDIADAETPDFIPERFRTDNAIDAEFKDAEDLTPIKENVIKEEQKSLFDKFNDYCDYLNDHPFKAMGDVAAKIGTSFGGLMRRHSFNKMKRSKQIFRQGDFDYILRKDGSLVLLKYRGNERVLKIPSVVGNKPVLYLHPDFLYSQTNPFDNYKARDFMYKLRGVDENSFESDKVTIEQIILPESLLAISDKTFYGCTTLHYLVIPASVRSMSNNAFKKSSIQKLFFNGTIPKNFDTEKYVGNIYVTPEEYRQSFA